MNGEMLGKREGEEQSLDSSTATQRVPCGMREKPVAGLLVSFCGAGKQTQGLTDGR